MQPVQITMLSDNIAQLKLCDSAQNNSFTQPFIDALLSALDQLEREPKLSVVLLSGLPSIFCAGADLATLQQLGQQQMLPSDITLPKRLLDFPLPIIAVMEGHAVGGGLALGLCADIIMMAEESRYGCSFMNMGFTPGMGTTRLLEHVMSPAMAHELLYTGEMKKGKELKGKTDVNYILPKKELMPLAVELAERIAEKPNKSLKLLKRTLSMRRRKLYEETISMESMMHEICFSNHEIINNIEANYVS